MLARALPPLLLTATLLAAGAARATTPPVAVFPSPGTRYNQPRTQITFRGIPFEKIGAVTVTGSRSGAHGGRLVPDSDDDGGSFLPTTPFTPGETVTVRSSLAILGGRGGAFSFGIARPAGLLPYGKMTTVAAVRGGVQRYRSAPGLNPATVDVTLDRAPASQGDFFLAPQYGPVQNGPMILDPRGNLVWFLPLPASSNQMAADFRVQQLFGHPVLTWWEGNSVGGYGRGVGEIYDSHYQPLYTVRAANGLDADLHEFLLTNAGQAFILAVFPIHTRYSRGPLLDSVIQEIDIRTGLVLFEWDALDHIPVSQSYFTPPAGNASFDPYHLNSISLEPDGNLVVSARNTSAVYEIDRLTGRVLWTLGGKASSFALGPGTRTGFQHDAVIHPGEQLTVFDDGGGPPRVETYSRALRLELDLKRRTATLIRAYPHSPPLAANFEGSAQPLSDGDMLIGWGQQPYFSEDDAAGRQIFDAHFLEPAGGYRAYRFPWSAQPPASQIGTALSEAGDGLIDLYASWNGATGVAAWQVLGGEQPSSLEPLGRQVKRGFETEIEVRSVLPYYRLQALAASGQVLGSSPTQISPPHLAVFGASAFTSSTGRTALPVACYEPRPCLLQITVEHGDEVIGRAGAQRVPAGAGTLALLTLGRRGRALLTGTPENRLAVRVKIRDEVSGATATSRLRLIGYQAAGAVPPGSLSQSPTLQLLGRSDFVSAGGTGGILAGCLSTPTPCPTRLTITAGHTVLAHTGTELLGANALGYLIFSLTRAGVARLAHAHGNRLVVHVAISDQAAGASGDLTLIRFR